MSLHLRPAGTRDADFLAEMLVAAAFWRADGPDGSVAEVLRDPHLARYVAGWPRPGDLGVVASIGQIPVGAAWARPLPDDEPGYGFVSAATPEVAMGVVAARRRQGVGRCLLDALVDLARQQGLSALSLSVEPDNHARRLYARAGFEEVAQVTGSLTMLRRLPPPG